VGKVSNRAMSRAGPIARGWSSRCGQPTPRRSRSALRLAGCPQRRPCPQARSREHDARVLVVERRCRASHVGRVERRCRASHVGRDAAQPSCRTLSTETCD